VPYIFRLQSLLRLRQSYEDREKLRLARIATEINYVRGQYAILQESKRQAWESLAGRLQNRVLAAELQLEDTLKASRQRRQRELLALLQMLEQAWRKQEQAYLGAKRQREILERLREAELSIYQMQSNRREQQRLDDVFAQQRSRSQRTLA
jgi:flagellar export protein FliJ